MTVHVRHRRLCTTVLWVVLAGSLSGCILLLKKGAPAPIDPGRPPTSVTVPIKAHLEDGDVAVFANGGTFEADTLRGTGTRYGIALDDTATIQQLPLREVVAMETYEETVRGGASLLASTVGTAVGAVASSALAVAIFGSCPTVYSRGPSADGDSLTLEAESFSNSIAPMLELRDVDALAARPDAQGRLVLEVRNEALETHYINHLEVVGVTHRPGERAYPADDGRAWVVGDVRPPSTIRDAGGRSLADVLGAADGVAYRTPRARLQIPPGRAATIGPAAGDAIDALLTEHIDLTLPRPPTDSVAVLLRLRNSLLNTVLFYDYMLAGQGARSLEWLGRDLQAIPSVMALSDFYARRMGLRVQVRTGAGYRTVDRVQEVGPIAWSRQAVPVPVPPGSDSLHVRLSFVPDAWRLDHVAVAERVRRSEGERHPVADLRIGGDAAGEATRGPSDTPGDDSARAPWARERLAQDRLSAPDHDYWVTLPTDRFWATFETGTTAPGAARSFFLAAQGYYIEWIRRDWLRADPLAEAFAPSDALLVDALNRWAASREDWEAKFEASRLPVR
jgi:hypothetical protein